MARRTATQRALAQLSTLGCAIAIVAGLACSEAPRPANEPPPAGERATQLPSPALEVRSSGRVLSGSYETEPNGERAARRLNFTVEGEFQWTDGSGEPSSGTYVIDVENRLILFVEAINEQRLSSAQLVVLQLTDRGDSIELADSQDVRTVYYRIAAGAGPG